MFYAVIATYVTHDLVFEDASWFIGPHDSLQSLDRAINGLGLLWEENAHNATVLRLVDGQLECIHSATVGDHGVDFANTVGRSA